ncbi:pentapeptide repeat-containing protein [Streptomyces sp. NPDC049555]|uniref:pentapeptide repeat-containing protein n=1 Tax=Streptomyces sp. NPDC049555 TaxID=3154930 RepID=UPI00341F3377
MTNARRGQGTAARLPRLPQVRLPELWTYEGVGLEPEGDHEGVGFREADFTGQDGATSRFIDCLFERCVLDDTGLGRARFADCVLDAPRGVGTGLAGASLRDVEIRDARLGGTQLHGAVLERVLVRGGKIDYLNLRSAVLKDVTFEGCVLAEADFGGATLERVVFRDCVLRRADLTGARLTDVDLREAAELDVAAGIERLAGAVVTPAQLLDLAPAFAAHIGLRVAAPGE